jgi:hypothetical protein
VLREFSHVTNIGAMLVSFLFNPFQFLAPTPKSILKTRIREAEILAIENRIAAEEHRAYAANKQTMSEMYSLRANQMSQTLALLELDDPKSSTPEFPSINVHPYDKQ